MKKIVLTSLLTWGLSMPAASASAGLVLSEVFYDAVGGDNGYVFVELYGPPGLDLTGYLLEGVNGANGEGYLPVPLDGGVLPEDGIFVIGDDDGSGNTLVGQADWLGQVDYQNGPDSVRLTYEGRVIDALGYGSFSAGEIFAGEGSPAPGVPAGSSLARFFRGTVPVDTDDNAADFLILTTPSPGLIETTAVPLPPAVWLLGTGILGIIGLQRRKHRG